MPNNYAHPDIVLISLGYTLPRCTNTHHLICIKSKVHSSLYSLELEIMDKMKTCSKEYLVFIIKNYARSVWKDRGCGLVTVLYEPPTDRGTHKKYKQV